MLNQRLQDADPEQKEEVGKMIKFIIKCFGVDSLRFPKIFGNLDIETPWDHKTPSNMLLKKIMKAFEPQAGAKRGSIFAT